MKLITLNIWGGHVKTPLLKFISAHQETDIFCFQEVYRKASHKISADGRIVHLDIFSELSELLPKHQGFFRPVVNDMYGISMFVKNTIDVLAEGEIVIHEDPNYSGMGPRHARNLQWAECRENNKNYAILNVHGLWNGMGKTDTSERILQSERIRDFMQTIKAPKVLCGDLNLRPDTDSLKIIEEGMQNLVQLHNIRSTRSSFYPKEEKFADYIFTSPEITVKHFEVLPHEVSDHLPLLVEFF